MLFQWGQVSDDVNLEIFASINFREFVIFREILNSQIFNFKNIILLP